MYIAYRAGAVDKATLERVHAEAADAALIAYRATSDIQAGGSAYFKVIGDYLGPGERTRFSIDPTTGIGGPDIPAGHMVLVD
jgi:hypothetical protein